MKKYVAPAVIAAVVVGFLALRTTTPHLYRDAVPVHLIKLWHLAVYAALWLAVYFAGRGFLRLFGYAAAPPEFAAAAGVVVFASASLLLAAVHLAYPWAARGVTLGVLAAGCYPWARSLRGAPARVGRWFAKLEVGPAALLVFGALRVAPLALAAAQPPIYWDALTYHLAIPHHYARAHGFVYLPYNVYASMPLGATMFYLWGMLWDGVICANALYFGVSALALALIYRLGRLWLNQFYAVVASFLIFFTPVFFVVMPGAHVDHFLMLYAAAAFYCYARPAETAASWKRAAVTGIFIGASLSVKYQGVYIVAALAPAVVYDLARRRLRLRDVALALGVASLFSVPWIIKAYIERGNPLFPLFYNYFGGRDFSAAQAERLVSWQYGMGAGRALRDYLLLPYRISVYGDFDYGSFAGVYLPFFLPLALLGTFLFRKAWRLAAFGWVYFAAWALGPQQLRFFAGGFGALGVIAAGAFAAADGGLGARARGWWRAGVVAVLMFAGLAFNIGSVIQTLEGYGYLAKGEFKPFLRERCGFYAAQEFINEHTPPGSKILMVFTNHTLYLERPAIYDSFFETSPFLMAAEKGGGPADLYRLARRWRVDYIHVFHMFEGQTWKAYNPRTKSVFYEFLNTYGEAVYKDAWNDVYRLKPGAAD